jgi:hypothetical protein
MERFSLAQSNILKHYKVSLECKTWIIVHTALKNEITREELLSIEDVDDWAAITSYNNKDNDKNSIWSFIREWYSPSCEDYAVQRRKYYLLLKWFISETLNENHTVKYTKAMGLGLYANENTTIDELSNTMAGFLEFIDESMFQTLEILGYNSLYKFDDNNTAKKKPHWCILFGPLSLVNASAVGTYTSAQVGFANVNSDYSEYLLYTEFKYEFRTFYKKVRSKKIKHLRSSIKVDDFDASENLVYNETVKTDWNQHRVPIEPYFKYKEERKIVPRVHISWCGRKADISNERRIVKKREQILIDYGWIKQKVFYNSADYKPEKQFIEDDDDEEEEEQEEQQEEQDDDYNENDDDDDGKHNNNNKHYNNITEYFTITISSKYGG